jgi:hypothetical protein
MRTLEADLPLAEAAYRIRGITCPIRRVDAEPRVRWNDENGQFVGWAEHSEAHRLGAHSD